VTAVSRLKWQGVLLWSSKQLCNYAESHRYWLN
jgi:hypothetical protein